MHLAHFFNFVKINNKASFVCVVLLDALSAKDRQVIGTIEVLYSLVMLFAQQTFNTFIIIKVDITQYVVSLHNFIKNVKVKRQLIDTFHLLNQLSADWTSDSEVVVKHCQTLCAKSMAAVN